MRKAMSEEGGDHNIQFYSTVIFVYFICVGMQYCTEGRSPDMLKYNCSKLRRKVCTLFVQKVLNLRLEQLKKNYNHSVIFVCLKRMCNEINNF
jgi:hypothetical protein